MILWLDCKVLQEVIQEQEEQPVDKIHPQDPFRFLQLRWRP